MVVAAGWEDGGDELGAVVGVGSASGAASAEAVTAGVVTGTGLAEAAGVDGADAGSLAPWPHAAAPSTRTNRGAESILGIVIVRPRHHGGL
ncbi:hypothetical protein AADG42_09300 [Ammonicoccus fulvus]|uniref:Uncharacterized protein n=1 Tax=Ammonicoccus fulvus TaxID=3138240 RepID=A0ABZ3FS00_9ACTN